MRGPVATKVITQLVSNTNWGELDYLVIDMPPGTGDIQITLSQLVSLSGAVIVTTPHELALADAAKGVTMFEDLQIPTLAVVRYAKLCSSIMRAVHSLPCDIAEYHLTLS
jgi:ATP-binding protein involved in chromosome partitioning